MISERGGGNRKRKGKGDIGGWGNVMGWIRSRACGLGSRGSPFLVSQSRRQRKERIMGKGDVDNGGGELRVGVGGKSKLESKRKLHKYHHY